MDPTIITILLDAGADPNAGNVAGGTILQIADKNEYFRNTTEYYQLAAMIRSGGTGTPPSPSVVVPPETTSNTTANPGGETATQYEWAYRYDYGEGVERNQTEAAKLYEQAANLGHLLAQNRLGEMYRDGAGVEKDLQQAAYWFQKAASGGHGPARASLEDLKNVAANPQNNDDELKKISANQATAQYNQAYALDYGDGIARNQAEAAKLYEQAANLGHLLAQNRLGEMYRDGAGVAKDLEKAIGWFKLAAKSDYAPAKANLADLTK
jgi:TPR repeat protein